jgi:hypothetical protein
MARPQVADVRWVTCQYGMARPQVADVRWVPCQHGMARLQVADGDALQVWRVAANILIPGQSARGGPPAWGLGVGLRTPHRKNKLVTKILKKPRTWTDSLDKDLSERSFITCTLLQVQLE